MKILVGLILVVLLSLVSCSKEDNKEEVDPLFSLPYHPLKDLAELKGKKFQYAGIKVEGRNAGLLTDASRTCSSSDLLIFSSDGENEVSSIEFFRAKVSCEGTDVIAFYNYFLIEEGILRTRLVLHQQLGILASPIPGENFVNGRFNLRIGFQGEYLRVEDRMSNYTRMRPDEEVFLYFKKYKY